MINIDNYNSINNNDQDDTNHKSLYYKFMYIYFYKIEVCEVKGR